MPPSPWSEDSLCAVGLSQSHLADVAEMGGIRALPAAGSALSRLAQRAKRAGFDLAIASGYRDYQRQLAIFNGKACGQRKVLDAAGQPLSRADFTEPAWLHKILRFSALPGTSRHHWGTDFDVWDARAVPEDYQLRLEPAEYSKSGVFADFAGWLNDCVIADDAEGFFKPYARDHSGVAPEPWHISYRASAAGFRDRLDPDLLREAWAGTPAVVALGVPEPLEFGALVAEQCDDLFTQYVV